MTTDTHQTAILTPTVPLGLGRRIPRWIFLRLLGAVYLVAFYSLWAQLGGLIGFDGIAPADRLLETLQNAGDGGEVMPWWKAPTLCWWLGASEETLNVLACAGMGLSLGLILGIWPKVTLMGLWSLYLSLFTISAPFLNFQWDILLLETSVIAFFYAPSGIYPRLRQSCEPSAVAVWLLRLLLFKLILSSGIVKLLSGDDSWLNLTALDYHFWTQPIPHPLSWYAHHSGDAARQAGVVFNHFVELFVPWLIIFNPRGVKCLIWLLASVGILWLGYGEYSLLHVALAGSLAALLGGRITPGRADAGPSRTFAALMIIALMCSVSLSGNYGFFNLLTIALAVTCFDDAFVYAITPNRLLSHLPQREQHTRPCGPFSRGLAMAAALILVPLNGFQLLDLVPRSEQFAAQEAAASNEASIVQSAMVWLSQTRQTIRSTVGGFALVNGYGLFRTMTKTRPELLVEGSRDGVTWQRYGFKYKPSTDRDTLAFAGLHMPRLDWQMWFAALYPRCSTRWFFGFLEALLEGSESVHDLLASNPFDDEPPRFVRVQRVQARFTHRSEWEKTGQVWHFEPSSPYCPAVDLKRLRRIKTRRHRR